MASLPGAPGAPLESLGCQEPNAVLPSRLDSIPERTHVDLLLIHGHHVHVTPALVLDDSRVHGRLADA